MDLNRQYKHLNMQVAFIDAEGTFRPERIKPIAERFELDADAVLDNVSISVTWFHAISQIMLLTFFQSVSEQDFF